MLRRPTIFHACALPVLWTALFSTASAQSTFQVVSQGIVTSGSTPQTVGSMPFTGTSGASGTTGGTADRGILKAHSECQNPALKNAATITIDPWGITQASFDVNDVVITAPPGPPPTGTMNLVLEGDVAPTGCGLSLWDSGVTVEVNWNSSTGSCLVEGSGPVTAGLLAGTSGPHFNKSIHVPIPPFGAGPQRLWCQLTSRVGGQADGLCINTGLSDFATFPTYGLRFPAASPAFSVPAGVTVNIPSLNIVNNYWRGGELVGVGPVPGVGGKLVLSVAPNPVRGQGELQFHLPRDGRALLQVFDVEGRVRSVPLDAVLASGPHTVAFPAGGGRGAALASGVYFARLTFGGQHVVRRIAVVR
ncbi:MAG: hypothetical protein HZB25_06175 [Candidatus Eisenbacteria bacterium]|nr:hypothetical protein [Candidatus Eisenbacteria bacterium]